jgi:3-oxoacyl-[acyl-carrier-protein] synthase II
MEMTSARSKAAMPVAITGRGIVTSLGIGKADNWRKLSSGQSGIRRIKRFAIDALRTTIAGTIDFVEVEPFWPATLGKRLAEIASEEAIEEAAIGRTGDFPGPLFLAIAPVETEWFHRQAVGAEARVNGSVGYDDMLRVAAAGRYRAFHECCLFGYAAEKLAERFGTKGSPISLSTACASGASAIQLGVEAIRRGETEAALCVGADGSITAESLIRFSLLSALSTANEEPEAAAKPFSKNRDGFVMAEGAAALVLENLEHARGRGARIVGVIKGCGEMADSFHRTRSSPDGKPIIGCIRNAIADAGLSPEDIDYINPHGTGTPENDKMECLGVMTVFGERAKTIPISSNKSMVGHTLSAAGAVEAVFTLLTLEHQRLPPTINYKIPDPAIPLDVVPNVPRDVEVRHALSNSFGFGGQNVSLVFGREPM